MMVCLQAKLVVLRMWKDMGTLSVSVTSNIKSFETPSLMSPMEKE